MIIAMACNKEWYKYLVVDLFSLLENNKSIKKVYLLLETESISEIPKLQEIIERYKIEIKIIDFNKYIDNFLKKECVNRDTIFSNFCFARLALPSLVDEDKILYIDTDAIVLKDISKLWKIDMSNYYIAGCKDYGIIRDGTFEKLQITGKYVNSGFIIMNLKKIREENIQAKWFEIINNNQLKYPDQDALNLVCQHKELYLPSMYNFIRNVTNNLISYEYIKVMHYAGPKIQWVVDKIYAELWYDALEKFCDVFGEFWL